MSFEGIILTSDNITVDKILAIHTIVQIVFGRVYHFDASV